MNYLKILKDLYRLKKNVKLSAGKMRSLQEKNCEGFSGSHGNIPLITGQLLKMQELRKNSWIHCLFPAFLPSTSRRFWSISMNWSQYLI